LGRKFCFRLLSQVLIILLVFIVLVSVVIVKFFYVNVTNSLN
jgi:hypothetical protein